MAKCDVIIPIYNAYDCLSPCIDSVIKNTDLSHDRIILIDDKSPDERVLPLLEKYSNGKNIILLKNDENLGFVGTVNKGMKYSKNDVLLLNSDTEVSKDWLEKIKKCAYSEKKIATVTPLSNNATLVSVPVGLTRNDLPSNMSFDEYSDLIDKTAYNSNQQLPTAHGFCMYIRREALNVAGFFDEETFGKGYGEENDFSFRCMDYGYKNVLCDSVIIYHKEKQSFSEKRQKLVEENSKKLEARYPIYCKKNELWCQSFPIKKHCENIDYQINMFNRKNILILMHDWTDVENNVGGTTLHVNDIINKLRCKYNFHVLYTENGIYKIMSYFENSKKCLNLGSVNSYSRIEFYNAEYKRMIESVVSGFRIDCIHVNHMIGHYMDVIDVADEKKINSIISLHDFYCLCPSINMLYMMEKDCIPMCEKDCQKCLNSKIGIKNNIVSEWRTQWNEFLTKFNKIIVPSRSTCETITNVYSDLKIDVIEHGLDIDNNMYDIDFNFKQFNVAFVGVMAVHKGAKILEYLIRNNKDHNIVYHLFGDSDFSYLKRNKKNYIYHGKYSRSDLPKLLKENEINLVCNLSICEETYSYTLTEVIASGVPVLGFDIGAVGQRIRDTKCGYTMPITEDNSLVYSKILDIYDNKEEYIKIVNNVKKYKIKSLDEMVSEYSKLYSVSKKIDLNTENADAFKKIIEDSFDNKSGFSSTCVDMIMNSMKWKVVSKIKVPNIVKRVARRLIH